MGSRLLLIGFVIVQNIVGMEQDLPSQEKEKLDKKAVLLKKIRPYNRDDLAETTFAHIAANLLLQHQLQTKDDIYTTVKPLLATHSHMVWPVLRAAVEYRNQKFPSHPLTAQEIIVKRRLFPLIKNKRHAEKIVTMISDTQQYNLLYFLISQHSKSLERVFEHNPLRSHATVLLRETYKSLNDPLMRKKVGAFAVQAKIDIDERGNGTSLLDEAIKKQSASLAQLYCMAGAKHESHIGMNTPHVHWVISQREGAGKNKLFDVLMNNNYSINHQDPATMSTPLMIACSSPKDGIVPVFDILKYNPDVNLINLRGHTALSCACVSHFWDAANHILHLDNLDLNVIVEEKEVEKKKKEAAEKTEESKVPEKKKKEKKIKITALQKTLEALEKTLRSHYQEMKYKKEEKRLTKTEEEQKKQIKSELKKIKEYKKVKDHQKQIEKLTFLINLCGNYQRSSP